MKAVVITGSTRGIGYAMAREFLRSGCRVTLSGRGGALPPDAQAGIAPFADRWIYVPCDVRKKADLQNLWDVSAAQWGTIDVWINNAGRSAPHELSCETGESDVEDILSTNLVGVIFGSQVAATGMARQKSGAIYSMEGLGSNNMIQARTILYGTTKHALTYYMRGLAKELDGSGILAGRLSPGMMLTDFITRSCDGRPAAIDQDARFKKIFNILADKPETVAAFFVPRILSNRGTARTSSG